MLRGRKLAADRITVDPGVDEALLAAAAARMEGFSGREIAKFMASVQAAVYGSPQPVLTPEIFRWGVGGVGRREGGCFGGGGGPQGPKPYPPRGGCEGWSCSMFICLATGLSAWPIAIAKTWQTPLLLAPWEC
jgi:hypothetical protein